MTTGNNMPPDLANTESVALLRDKIHDRDQESWHKANEAAVASGNMALRTAVLINGGAAVAILSFLSALAQHGNIAQGQSLADFAYPLLWFAGGVSTAALAMGSGYVTNYSNAGILSRRSRLLVPPFIEENAKTRRWRKSAEISTVVSVLLALASLLCFIIGVVEITLAIGSIPIVQAH